MSFDLKSLADAVALHGRVARVVVAQVHGSAPREAGAAMLVWDGGQSGTIGGGDIHIKVLPEHDPWTASGSWHSDEPAARGEKS